MFLEIDQVAIEPGLWARAKAGDRDAITELREMFDGTYLNVHALSCPQDWECVSLRELEAHGIVKSIVLRKDP